MKDVHLQETLGFPNALTLVTVAFGFGSLFHIGIAFGAIAVTSRSRNAPVGLGKFA